MLKMTEPINETIPALRIGAVNYLNTKPLVFGLPSSMRGLKVSFDLPISGYRKTEIIKRVAILTARLLAALAELRFCACEAELLIDAFPCGAWVREKGGRRGRRR